MIRFLITLTICWCFYVWYWHRFVRPCEVCGMVGHRCLKTPWFDVYTEKDQKFLRDTAKEV